jgi:multicomponent K+:H+ antiporter subunit A
VIVLPFALLIALSHVLYGGVGPGDGFTAGVITGLTIALWYVVFGYFEARERLSWFHPGRLIAIGLLVALANAVIPIFFGLPFLAHVTFIAEGPAELHLTSTLFFEIGIFVTVSGGTGVIMEAIAHPGETERM